MGTRKICVFLCYCQWLSRKKAIISLMSYETRLNQLWTYCLLLVVFRKTKSVSQSSVGALLRAENTF